MEKEYKAADVLHDEAINIPQHLNDETGLSSVRRAQVEKRLKLKLDLRFSILIIIYILNYIDRNNASQARLRGFEEDLKLKGQEFATLLSILYVGYILMQVPSNMIITKITRPSWYIAGAMLIWGAISVLTGITHNFVGALLTRFFLGFIEAAFLPGALFLLSKWYTKKEIALRYTILYSGNLISNAFGSLVAAGVLNNMQGVAGHAAWRWLFFIEGALTMGVALIAAVMLPDTLENSRGFSQEELAVARLRMMEDVGEADTAATDEKWYDGLRLCLVDYKIYILMLSLIAVVTGLRTIVDYLLGMVLTAPFDFSPTLTASLGYNRTETLLLCAPPWFFAVIVSLINSWHADKTQEKFYHSTWPLVMGIIGFIISMCTMNTAARYVALFLQASSFPRPAAKRAVAIALLNAVSQLGNIAGSYVWDKRFGKSYRVSYGIVLACFAIGIILNFAFRQILIGLNKKLEAGEQAWAADNERIDATAEAEGITREEVMDMRRGFRYLY
ncbi:hypothetical protein QFC20_001407 [Naganishia adeliensis]|uniref:Uncharacterized protein n=1 Tax=Naganishia adeliensis TaxID=92952 RepID=A0ACC2WRX3_9TREE|nr:hypothetical protein QFC20_001407 [Naganishia adeliensis]